MKILNFSALGRTSRLSGKFLELYPFQLGKFFIAVWPGGFDCLWGHSKRRDMRRMSESIQNARAPRAKHRTEKSAMMCPSGTVPLPEAWVSILLEEIMQCCLLLRGLQAQVS